MLLLATSENLAHWIKMAGPSNFSRHKAKTNVWPLFEGTYSVPIVYICVIERDFQE